MRVIGILICLSLLAACGGGNRYDREPAQVMRLSGGPIARACLASDRKARSRELCGCIQTVANQDLSGQDQRMAVKFYKDPHRAQEIRQSDRSTHEAFWKRYTGYAARAEQLCRIYR
ncbi:hypothetical protein ACOXXX_18675 [Thalassococcus sp. BH17M4-6]|uniref:hypothetical protein n=1 Tax=Thalassococcus sp. BH17M4-6 TaxID=3413148 RepID=UPI003BC5B059